MSTEPTDLVARYRSLPFPSDDLGDCAENHAKMNILRNLDGQANEPHVSQLLLDILATPNEYDLARIEAAKIVGLYINETSPLESQLKQQVWNIFADLNDDTLVRQHASQNLSVGFGGDLEHRIIERVLFDGDEDENVRHGALGYVQDSKDRNLTARIIPRLTADPYWGTFSRLIAELEAE